MVGESGTGTVPLLGPGLWVHRGPAHLVARRAGWIVLVPSTPAPVVEAAWELLADPPPARDVPAALAALHPQSTLSDLVVALRTGQQEIDLALLGPAPLAVHDAEGGRLLRGEEDAVRGWHLSGVRRLGFGDLPPERSVGAPRLESGKLGVRGLVHCFQDPAELGQQQRQALAAEVAVMGRIIQDPAEAELRPRTPHISGATRAPEQRGRPRDPSYRRPAHAAGRPPGQPGTAAAGLPAAGPPAEDPGAAGPPAEDPGAAGQGPGQPGIARPPERAGSAAETGPAARAGSPQAAGRNGPPHAPPASPQTPPRPDDGPGRVERLFSEEFAPLRRLRGSLAASAPEIHPTQHASERPVSMPGPLAGTAQPIRPVAQDPAPESSRQAYDELFGSTLSRRVEDAAVRELPDPVPPGPAPAEVAPAAAHPAAEPAPHAVAPPPQVPAPPPPGPADPAPERSGAGVPGASGAATDAPELIDRVPGVDRARRTSAAESPRASRQSTSAARPADPASARPRQPGPADPPGPDRAASEVAPSVQIAARTCPLGHVEDPARSLCRRCASPLGQEVARRERPALGALASPRGTAEPGVEMLLDRDAVIGRRPRAAGRSPAGDGPRLLAVDSPDQGLSRSHLAVRLVGWQVRVRDLGTVNGTVLHRPGQGPRPLGEEEITLADGDRLLLGAELPLDYREVP